MKFKTMMGKIGHFLSAERREQEEKRQKLKDLLKKMKDESKALASAIERCDDKDKRTELQLKLNILGEQRKKGVALRRELAGKTKQTT